MRRANRVRCTIRSAFQGLLLENRGAKGSLSHYGIRVPSYSGHLPHVDLALGFLAGHAYCCGEIGCHVPHWSEDWWRRFRKSVAKKGVHLPPSKLTIHVAVFTEPGARFSVHGPAARLSMYESIWREAESR